jgi:hypothetical protein
VQVRQQEGQQLVARQELAKALADSLAAGLGLLALCLVLGMVWWTPLVMALGFAVFRLGLALLFLKLDSLSKP